MRFCTITLLLVVLVSGCGGSPPPSDDVSNAPEPPEVVVAAAPTARADFLTDAKRVCARMGPRVERLGKPASPPTEKQLTGILDAWQLTLDDLRELTPPAGEAKRFRAMLAHFDASVRAAKALPAAKGEMSLVPVAVMADRGQKGARIAYAYGLEECSIFPPAPSQAEFEQYVLTEAKKSGGLLHPSTRTDQPGARVITPRKDR